ncbi:MAG: ABC-2 family transporter protein [Candidatus Anstonellales archaeon]
MIKIAYRFLLNSLKRYEQYRIELVYSVMTLLIGVFITPAMWYVVTGGGKNLLSGWSFEYLTILSMSYSMMFAFMDALGYWDIWIWFEKEGRKLLSNILTKPLHPLFYMYGLNLFPYGIIQFMLNAIALFSFAAYTGVEITACFLVMILLGALIMFNLLNIMLATYLVFDKVAKPLMRVGWALVRYGNMPLGDLKGAFQVLFSFIIPIAFVAALPVEALISNDCGPLLPSAVMALLSTLLLALMWNFGLRRFEAVGG